MNPKPIAAIVCPLCDELFPEELFPQSVKAFQCSECQAIYYTKDEAEDCCKN